MDLQTRIHTLTGCNTNMKNAICLYEKYSQSRTQLYMIDSEICTASFMT